MARVFAYIAHKGGIADDAAAELVAAARKIDAAASPVAVVTGWGVELDAVCETLRGSYAEVWKIANQALAYPNAELVRKALLNVLPHDGIVLVSHSHFGIDLSPGLAIKMNSAFVSDVLGIDGIDGTYLKLVRQEFGGQVSAHVRCDASSGAVLNLRPGAFKPQEVAPINGVIVDKSAGVGALTADGVISRPLSPRRAMSISPSTPFWFRSAGASRRKTTSPSLRSWPKRWARRSVAPGPWSMPSGCRNPAR